MNDDIDLIRTALARLYLIEGNEDKAFDLQRALDRLLARERQLREELERTRLRHFDQPTYDELNERVASLEADYSATKAREQQLREALERAPTPEAVHHDARSRLSTQPSLYPRWYDGARREALAAGRQENTSQADRGDGG